MDTQIQCSLATNYVAEALSDTKSFNGTLTTFASQQKCSGAFNGTQTCTYIIGKNAKILCKLHTILI